MKKLLTIIFVLICGLTYGQDKYVHGHHRAIDSNYSKCEFDTAIYMPAYATSDTDLVLSVRPNGLLFLTHKAAGSSSAVNSVFGRTNIVTAQAGDYTTTLVTEGTNLYYTTGRVANKANYTDTAAMLLPYLRKGDTASMLNAYLRKGDTSLMLSPYLRSALAAATYVSLAGSYTNPAWVVSLPWSKITSTPTTIAGYGITDPIVYTSGSYVNPAWITSLAYAKITGVPAFLTLGSLSATSPLFYDNTTGVFTIQTGSASQAGAISSTDWSTFNGKQNALGFTAENVANKATSMGTLNNTLYPTTLALSNYIASFGYTTNTGTVTSITAGAGLSGGVITSAGTVSMPNTGTADTYGSGAGCVVITTDAQGRVTTVTTTNVTPAYANITGLPTTLGGFGITDAYTKTAADARYAPISITGTVTSVTAGTGLSGGVITSTGTISMPNTGAAGTYGGGAAVPIITTDAQGRVTTITTVTPTPGNLTGPITSVGLATSVAAQTGTGSTFVMQASPTLTTPNIGTPSAGVLTSCTGLPVSTGISGLGTGVATFLATPSSANLLSAITDETGTGVAVFGTAPTLSNPVVGTQSALDNSTKAASTAYADALRTATATFTNKRWTARVGTTTSSATPTINTDNVDIYKLTAQTADITSFSTNLSGTPVDGDILEIQVTGTAARAITWGASFVSSTVTIPATTVTTATLTVVFQYYSTSSYGNNKYVCVNYY